MPSDFVPAPPKLAYLNSTLRSARSAVSPTRSSRPGTAPAAVNGAANKVPPLRPGTATQRSRKTFLQDNEAAVTLLPQALPPGISYVAAFTTFDDLIKRNILQQGPRQQVHLSLDHVRLIYEAKCEDQCLKSSWEREVRFLEVVSLHCRGQHFSLSENGLGPQSAAAISQVLATSEAFTVLDLSGNRIKDAGAKHIATLLTSNDCIVHLGLKSNDIGHEGVEALCEALNKNNTLTSLDLGGIRGINRNHVSGRGAEAIGNLLATNRVLWSLDLSSNGLGLEGCGLVSSGLKSNDTIRRLYLANNNIGHEGTRLLASALVDAHVEVVDLRGNDMGDAGVAHVAASFQPGTEGGESIREVYLDQNDIRDAGCIALAPLIRNNVSLRKLHLDNNPISVGFSPFFDNMKESRSLRELSIVQCGMGEAEAAALGRALSNGSLLQFLDISRNRIGDSGGAKIFNALIKNGSLETIIAGGCAFRNVTGDAVATVLKQNKTLTEIDLRQNTLHGEVGDALLEALGGNLSVRVLDLSFNDIPYLAQAGIDAAVRRNREAWKRGESKRLESEIESLGFAQRDLFQVEEDIESERRAIKDRGDELVRRKDTARGQTENNRRVLKDLQDALAAVTAIFNDKRDHYRAIEEQVLQDQQRMELKVSSMNRRLENEREKKDRVAKETERLRRQLRAHLEQQEIDLKPLVIQFEAADGDRQAEMGDARWQAEALVDIELKILAREASLGMAPERGTAAAQSAEVPKLTTPRRGTQVSVRSRSGSKRE